MSLDCFSFPICQCRGTVFVKIWWQVMAIAIYSMAISTIHKKIIFPTWHVTIPWTLVPILGVATGMLLVFRTNTAYDRYWEARKLWSSMTTAIRNLTRNIWVGIKEPEDDSSGPSKVLVEKVSALNILSAFGYATRNYLRGEYSYEDADLKGLLRHIPKIYNIECPCRKKNNPAVGAGGGFNSLLCKRCYTTKTYTFMAYEEETPTNIPMELSYLLASYIKTSNARGLIDPSLLAPLNNALNSLVDCVTGFERILRTPIPLAYSVHLHHATWIYLLTLPPQLVEALGWGTAFATSLAAFCLLGVLEIGWEIENPFGKDYNDLPLDDFCRVTHREIQKIMGRKVPSTDVWLMSLQNRPLAPVCAKNAVELARLPPEDLRSLMKRNPVEIRKYFQNLGYVPDDIVADVPEKKKVEVVTSSVETVKSSKTSLEEKVEEKSVSSEKSEVEEEEEEDDEEEVEREPDTGSKRVSFALPADDDEGDCEGSEEEKKSEVKDDQEEDEEDEEGGEEGDE